MIPLTEPLVDVLIVGAGLSGLRAARAVHEAGFSYVVLEAMDRVGGKTLSLPTWSNSSSDSPVVDVGAAWINDSNQSEMFALSQEFGFDLIVQRSEGKSVYTDDATNQTSVVEYGMPADLSPEQLLQFAQLSEILSSYVDRSNLTHPASGPDAGYLDSLTALDLVSSPEFEGLDPRLAEFLLTTLTRSLLGVEPSELSALYLIDYIKSGQGLANIISDTKDGAQYLRNRQGNLAFSTRLAASLNPGSVHLSEPVDSITYNNNNNNNIVKTKTGKTYSARKIILSPPTSLLPLISFSPPLPVAKNELIHSTHLGYFAKTILVYGRPWWREAGLSGVFSTANGAVAFTRDSSSEGDEHHHHHHQWSLTCFHVGDPGRSWSDSAPEERRKIVLGEVNEAFGVALEELGMMIGGHHYHQDQVPPEPINVIEKIWEEEEWIRGVPSPVMMPGLMTSEAGKSVRDSVGDLHFVGTETSFVWKGYMEGAVRSGVRGAEEVIEALVAAG